MFGIGIPELLVIGAVALIFIGPQKLPSVLRALGRGMVEFKRASNEIRTTVQNEMDKVEEELHLNDIKEIKKEVENDLGSVASSFNPLSFSQNNNSNIEQKLGAVADAMESAESKKKEA